MKKIMFLHSGAELYGADKILLDLTTNINKKEFEPLVVLPNYGPLVEKLKDNNIRVEVIPYPIIRRKYFNFKGIISFFIQYFKSSKKLYKFAQSENIDIIHNNTIAVLEGLYLKKKLKKPLIVHIHEMIDKPKIIAKILYSIIAKKANKIVVVSNAVKNHINKYTKIKNEKMIVIQNGIDIEKYKENIEIEYLKKELKIKENSIIVGIIGRINAIKGQEDFIDAMSILLKNQKNNLYGIIVGDAFNGQEWRVESLKNKIEKYGLKDKIIYCGFRNDILNIHKLIDIYILSSIENDSFPTVVLEAMASKKPVVAYKCGGVSEMVENDVNGYLIEKGNKQKLAEAINTLIKDEDLRKSMGENSYRLINEKFSITNFIRNFETMYNNLL